MMKKLVLSIASVALASAPVLACPGHDNSDDQQQTPKTAEKPKETEKAKQPDKAKPAPKQDTSKQADKDKAKEKPAPTKPTNDKVSQK
jgi:Ni/Co efflux regulator RcnB